MWTISHKGHHIWRWNYVVIIVSICCLLQWRSSAALLYFNCLTALNMHALYVSYCHKHYVKCCDRFMIWLCLVLSPLILQNCILKRFQHEVAVYQHTSKRVIQTNPSKFDERLFSSIYLCRLRLKQGRQIHDFIFWGREFQRDAPAKDMLLLNKSSLGLGT